MYNDRLSILLPANSFVIIDDVSKLVTHMQIKKNDLTQRYELRFFNEEKLIVKTDYHNMTLNVISDKENDNQLSIHISENSKSNYLELLFETEKDVVRIKKYVDTLLI